MAITNCSLFYDYWSYWICVHIDISVAWQVGYPILIILQYLTFLCSGTLFGGIVLRLSKIPAIFKINYFISVPAVTQRALVVNDMECCYLTMTCNSMVKEMKVHTPTSPTSISDSSAMFRSLLLTFNPRALAEYNANSYSDNANSASQYFSATSSSSNFCPPGLQFSGDGSDEGNLGRMYLKFMGLDHDFPFFSLLILFWMNVIFRCLAGLILYFRIKYRCRLKHVGDIEGNNWIWQWAFDAKARSNIFQ